MRVCVVCGVPIDGRRSDARHCSGACRAEAARLRGILRGEGSSEGNVPYRSIEQRLRARRGGTVVAGPRGGKTTASQLSKKEQQ